MSWKQQLDGNEKRQAFLREMKERDSARRPIDPSGPTRRSTNHRVVWIPVLALFLASAWLLR